MLTLTHLVGMCIAALTGAGAAALLARAWPLARLGRFGAPAVGAFIAAPASYLLQLFGAGGVGFREGAGVIDWTPVASTMLVGGVCAFIGVGAVGLMRYGGRSRR